MTEIIYGDKIADIYDKLYPSVSTAQIDFLGELAGEGQILELGIGTGRIAIPLLERGFSLHGIEISPRMIEKLRAKPGGEKIVVTQGSFVEIPAPHTYSLIFAAFNTFFGLPTRDDQFNSFKSIEKALVPGGKLVIEAIVPDLSSFTNGKALNLVSVSDDEVELSASVLDTNAQTLMAQKITISESGIRMIPTRLRYAWPSELDLMGELAGLPLAERYGWWDKREFRKGSSSHISVYAKPR